MKGTWRPALAGLAGLLVASCTGPAVRGPAPFPTPGGPPRSEFVDSIRVGVAGSGGYAPVAISLEIYVARVLGGEAAPDTPPAALDALAVAVRTYGLANLNRHASEGFDVCDQTHCQVVRAANADTERAAEATAGQVLLRNGSPALIYYSASCGGRSEIPSAVWPGADDPDYLPSRPDEACGGEPAWTTEMSADDLERALEPAGFSGTLRDVRIAARGASGKVATVALEGLTPAAISAQDLRMAVSRVFGPRLLRSTSFELGRQDDRYTFTGNGYGHGVGMCVIGAMHRAERGETAAAILLRYFPGLEIGRYRRMVTD